MSLVFRLAEVTTHREARNGAGLAPEGLEIILALAVASVGKQWPAPDLGRAQIAHATYDLGERFVGPAKDPSGAGEAGVQSLCSNGRQVHASAAWARAVAGVADLSQAARWRNLGLRLHQRADDSFQDTPYFLHDSSR